MSQFPHPNATPHPPRDGVGAAIAWLADHSLPTGWVLVYDSDTGVVEVQWRKGRHTPPLRQDLVASLVEEAYGPPDTATRVGVAIWPRTPDRPAFVVEGVTGRDRR